MHLRIISKAHIFVIIFTYYKSQEIGTSICGYVTFSPHSHPQESLNHLHLFIAMSLAFLGAS